MNLFVQVYDNDGAFVIYKIPQPVTVRPDLTNLKTIVESLVLPDLNFEANIILNQGSYLASIQVIQSISSLLNEQSLSDKLGLILQNNSSSFIFPQIYGPLANYTGVHPNKDINAYQHNINRNSRSKARDALIYYINNISISDMDSVRTQLGMLAMITSQTDEITRSSGVNFFCQIILRISNSLAILIGRIL